MTNRENPVWQMAYAVEFARQMCLRLYDPVKPDIASFRARVIADAAVEALGEPKPVDATAECNASIDECANCDGCEDNGVSYKRAQPCCVECGAPVLAGNVCQKCMLKPGDIGVMEAPTQPRDESMDIALNRSDVRAVLRRETTQCGALVPFRVDFRERDNWQRYVPYSQLESAHRDSELLDAILEAHGEPDDVARAIKNAIAERAKR